MYVYWVLSHMCKVCVCVFFFPGPDCMCVFCDSEVHVCTQSPHTFFFPRAWLHFLVPPSAQTLSLFLCMIFSFSELSSAVHWFRLLPPPPLPFLCLFRIHYPDFFPLSFLPDSQAAAVPNSLALHFFKATFKKQVDHTPPTYEIMLGK